MLGARSDQDWEWFGRNDPYYGVVSWDSFHRENLDENAAERFFLGGEQYVQKILGIVDERVASGFRPRRVLDFGCGVGRCTIPLARRSEKVVGVDVSGAMLSEAARNCAQRKVGNAEFVKPDALRGLRCEFDLVHSFIVFQHIPVRRGMALTEVLLDLIAPGGVGVLHYTYRQDPRARSVQRLVYGAYRFVPFAYALRRLIRREPVVQMYAYDLNALFHLLQERGCRMAHAVFTDHSYRGVILLFRKQDPAEAPACLA
jgi:SAM-dependent methyltransferase